jgi:uncharacterized protein YndB with AHSA1/START domain
MKPRSPARETLHVTTPDERTIVVERSFDAPRPRVWDAWTKPELMRRWLVDVGWILDVCDVDVRPGGAFRWLWKREDDGSTMGLSGVYREVQAPVRLVNTEVFDVRWYPGDALITLELSESGGRTHTRYTWRYDSTEARDIVLRTAISGLEISYERLDEMLTGRE